MTSALSSRVRIKFGIFGCEVARKTVRAVAVMPLELATSRKFGPMTMRLGALCLASTTWQALQALRAKTCPAATSPSCAGAFGAIPASATASARQRIACGMILHLDAGASTTFGLRRLNAPPQAGLLVYAIQLNAAEVE